MKGLSRESRLLIDAARDGDNPSAGDRQRVRAALAGKIAVGAAAGAIAVTATHAAAGGVAGAGTSGALAGTVAAAAAGGVAGVGAIGGATAGAGGASIAAGALVTGFGAKVLVTVAIVGAVSAGTVGYARHESAKRSVVAAPMVALDRTAARGVLGTALATPPARSVAPSPTLGAQPIVSPLVVSAPIARKDLSPSPLVPTQAPSSKPIAALLASTPTSAAPSDLDAEIALLQGANGALRAKDGARALQLLDERTRRFPNGALAEESEAARVFALCQIGRPDEAHDVARRFLREHPRSPLAQRVARACDEEPSTF